MTSTVKPAVRRMCARLPASPALAIWLALSFGHSIPAHAASVSGSADDPVFLASKILSPTVDVNKTPSAAKLAVSFMAPRGLLYFVIRFISPSGTKEYITGFGNLPTTPPPPTSGTVVVANPLSFGLYSEAGQWNFEYAYIGDQAGTYVYYSASQLTALFSSSGLVVKSKTPDSQPPIASAGKILTPVLSRAAGSQLFSVQFTVSNPVSGMSSGTLSLIPPGSRYPGQYLTNLPIPAQSGQPVLYATLPKVAATGIWTISNVHLCDVAANCTDIDTAETIKALFGTNTFTVTD